MSAPRSWRRLRTWLRYRRYLAALVRDDRRSKIPPTPARIARLKRMAWTATREVGRQDGAR